MSNLYAVPQELRDLNCWVLWKFVDTGAAKLSKVPFQVNGNNASVTEPSHWSSFDQAFNTLNMGGFDGLGFVFDNSHPYSFIDLDDTNGDSAAMEKQIHVYKEFNSYSEKSPSGKGLHIIVKGKVPTGRRRSAIEIYSHNRYATMTGNVFNDKPIEDRNDLLNQLYQQMDERPKILIEVTNEPQSQEDVAIVEAASKASNGDKFLELYKGDWKNVYPDIAARGEGQSVADFALIDIITFYTKNVEQIARIFRSSVLGKRKKAERKDYINDMIKKAFDQTPMKIDFDNYIAEVQEHLNKGPVAQRSEPAAHNSLVTGSNPVGTTIRTSASLYPPGLVGEIATFIYNAAPRQVHEIAIAGALGLMAGVCGRAYNYNATGLNLYVLVLAKTGRGKEAAASGIDKLMNEVKRSVPTSTRFRGPGIINSGQALVKHLANTSNCFVSILGEFGLTIDRISNPNANSADKMLFQMLLDLYNKSGHGQTLQASIYSNKDDSVGITDSPAVSILGESTHKLFYKALTEDMISAGLLPRFLIIEYNGKREYLNENAANTHPDLGLVERFGSVVAHGESLQHSQKVQNVGITPEAASALRNLDIKSTDDINEAENEVLSELWNRAHMKIQRIAGLIAVGVDHLNPVITIEYVKWAQNLVEQDIRALSSKFESGEVGDNMNNEAQQIKEVLKKIKMYLERDWDYVKKYSRTQSLHSAKIISYEFLNKRLSSIAAFYADKRIKPSVAIENTLKLMINTGILKEVTKAELKDHKTEQKAYILNDMSVLSELDS